MTNKRIAVRRGNRPQWAATIAALRSSLHLSQTEFGQKLGVSAMGVSRWECGVQEPQARGYIELGNLAGDPDCWNFWARAGLRTEDLMRALPRFRSRLRKAALPDFRIVIAGSGGPKVKKGRGKHELVAIPLLRVVAASYGEQGDTTPSLHGAPVESMIAAPRDWCPNPAATSCLRVRGDSMNPLIYDGYIVAVDGSQNDRAKLDGKIVIAWHKESGLSVSRLRRYDNTEVLQSDNPKYKSVSLQAKNGWKILAKVLWWIGRAP
ncbi:MAG TPA: S24 family peptidase [Candidatus Acidoferrales bacterium]|nr:S24 family peptidase [Candidatus Acidoferrales bacterium]